MNAKMLCVVVLALLTGCAGTMKQLPDGRILSAVTVGDHLDRSATYVQILEVAGHDENGKPVLRQVAGDLTVGNTVGGDVARGVTNGLGVALVQRDAAIRTARSKSKAEVAAAAARTCPEGTLACNGTYIALQGAQAIAESNAVSESVTDVSGSLGTCADCGAIPID